MRIGNVEVYIVSDGSFRMDGGAVFGLVPKVLWEKVITPDELNRVPMNLNCLLIVSEGKRILVDTGMGDKLTPKEREIFSLYGERRLFRSLEKLGFSPEDIDIVINTHLHSDHCGGNTLAVNEEIVPAFPRAEYWIQRLEWADAAFPNERTRATYLAPNFIPLWERGKVRLLYGDTKVTSEVRCIVTKGHTRAHQSVLIESKGEKALYLGDLAPWAINMERLAWIPAFDVEPLETIETKRKIQQWALEEKAILFFEHDPFFPVGQLLEENGRYVVKPIEF
ncbi:MAG: MBL fold metallo-hydrolase [Anaerolineae bacterium]|nr:MBL fold metallo-hydrolase [Anaerolineae bacterium]MDW8102056.1 MBL fold metallo-hydrolase [Anaerolineae bacterium]